jgi:hypothetical protein
LLSYNRYASFSISHELMFFTTGFIIYLPQGSSNMGAFDHGSVLNPSARASDALSARPNGAIVEALAGLPGLSQRSGEQQQTSSPGVADMLKGFSVFGENGADMATGVIKTVMSGLGGLGQAFAGAQDVPPEDPSAVQGS